MKKEKKPKKKLFRVKQIKNKQKLRRISFPENKRQVFKEQKISINYESICFGFVFRFCERSKL
jgi:hypothetical protein